MDSGMDFIVIFDKNNHRECDILYDSKNVFFCGKVTQFCSFLCNYHFVKIMAFNQVLQLLVVKVNCESNFMGIQFWLQGMETCVNKMIESLFFFSACASECWLWQHYWVHAVKISSSISRSRCKIDSDMKLSNFDALSKTISRNRFNQIVN